MENHPTTSIFTPTVAGALPAICTVMRPLAGLGRPIAMFDTLWKALKFSDVGDAGVPPDGYTRTSPAPLGA